MTSTNESRPRVMVDARKVADSGIGTYIRNIVPRVAARMPDAEFLLLGSDDSLRACLGDSSSNCSVVESSIAPLSLKEQFLIPGVIPKNIDLFWATHFNIPLAYNGRLLVTIHDLLPMAAREYGAGIMREHYVRTMITAMRLKKAAIVSVSEFTTSELKRLGNIDSERITTIHEAVDDTWKRVRAADKPPREGAYLLFVGLQKPHKNLLGLLKAFELLQPRWPHALVIVGDREKLASRDEYSAEFAARFGERVEFTGWVTTGQLEQYLAHADALVMPSLYEGFGLPALEAMACGCPVVASRAASLPEVCGDAAIYFNPRDPAEIAAAIEICIGSKERREEMRRSGLVNVERFDWDRAADGTAATIRDILTERR